MKIQKLRPLWTLGLVSVYFWMSGCALVRSGTSSTNPVAITNGSFTAINAGSAPVILTANRYVNWELTLANQPCAPGCGTLTPTDKPSVTATYTPPMTVPSYGTATIIASAPNDNTIQFILSFRIVGAIQVNITTTKFQSALAGSAPIPIAATISNDVANQGLAWTLTAGGSNCAPSCGSLSVSAAPSLTAIYTPPPTAPSGAADSPTIQVSSVTKPQTSDSFSFAIQPAIIVSITSAKFTSVLIGSTAINITASITNDPANAGLTWSLTAGGASCSPSCGTLVPANSPSLTAVYTPPATLPPNSGNTITITASSVTNPLANDTIPFLVVPIITVNITSPKFTTASAGASPITVVASVINDVTGKGVNWTLTAGGAPCDSTCGTLVGRASNSGSTFTALYTPPTIPPSGAKDTPTITVSSVAEPSAQDSFTFTINSSDNLLTGSYAFLMRGYTTAGAPLAMAGTLTADGAGSITAGEIDINDDGGTLSIRSPLAGTYTIDLSFNNVTRGNIVITNFTFPGTTTQLKFDFTLSADGTRGKIIEMDGAGYREAGTFLKQDPTALAAANPSGSYAFGLDADAPLGQGGRTVEDGQFVLGAGGNVISGLADLSRAAALLPIYTGQALDPGTGTAPDASGRGQLTLSLQGNQAKYAYYIVNSGQLNLLEIDNGWAQATAQAGTARLQQTFTADSVNMTGVLQMTGIDVSPGPSSDPSLATFNYPPLNVLGPHVEIGQMIISGRNTFNIFLDSNDLGVVTKGPVPDITKPYALPTVAFDPTTGRGEIDTDHGYDEGFVNTAVFYLYAPGSGFMIDADPSPLTVLSPDLAVTNQGYSGTFFPQTDPSTVTVSGNMIVFSGSSSTPGFNDPTILGTSNPPIPDIPEIEGAVNLDAGQNATFAVQLASVSFGNFPGLLLPPDSTRLNGLIGSPDSTLGRGIGHVQQVFSGQIATGYDLQGVIYYAIGNDQLVAIGSTPGLMSGVMFFDPQ